MRATNGVKIPSRKPTREVIDQMFATTGAEDSSTSESSSSGEDSGENWGSLVEDLNEVDDITLMSLE